MKRKRLLKLLIGFIVLLFIINIVASFYFYHLAIERGPKDFLVGNADLEVSAAAMDEFIDGDWHAWLDNQSFEEFKMTSYDGLTLKAYYLKAKQPTTKTVILAHGYLGSGKDMGLYARYYHDALGYNVLMPDARGQGESEGDYIGFGWHDRLDYADWADLMIDKLGDNAQIVLHGVSMGAATVLMTSGENLPDNVKAIVSDSAYTSVRDMFAYQMKRMYHIPSFPVLPTTSLVTKMEAGYWLTEASALDQVKKATVPILYIHGNADKFAPARMSEELYKNTKSDAELMIVDGAGHAESFVLAQDKYEAKLQEFLGKYVE
ncbi:alpha/beta hydrolase [Lentibacillus sp. N15]|uniref:alpha/beta hydrolase n=1 Tax=Lentibacillus songyuanensis TaxID=3136161 RepID=UPI0031BAD219